MVNLIQILIYLLKNTKGMSIQINLKDQTVYIIDAYDQSHEFELSGELAKIFFQEWIHHEH